MLEFRLDDEGDYLELIVAREGRQCSAFLVDIEPLGVDLAYKVAQQVEGLLKSALGDGGGSAP